MVEKKIEKCAHPGYVCPVAKRPGTVVTFAKASAINRRLAAIAVMPNARTAEIDAAIW
jgi:hypothetical protein